MQLGEFFRHRRVASRQLLHRHILRLVIGKAQIPISAEKSIFCFLQVIDRFIDFIDGRLKATGGEIVVSGKCRLERLKIVFEVGHINVLSLHQV